jgi:hypothetical protein
MPTIDEIVLFQRGCTAWGFQIGRLYLYWPYWRFIKCGCRPKFGWEWK